MPHITTVSISAAHDTDIPAVLALLEQNGLPQDGFLDHVGSALVGRADGSVVGSAALELYGTAALLRSVAVAAQLRGQGIGQLITRSALDLARQHAIETVYLLTETASDFFPRFGFRPIERSAVDPAVQQSVEFTSACPSSAQVFVATLTHATDIKNMDSSMAPGIMS